jgi:hypothetical protein
MSDNHGLGGGCFCGAIRCLLNAEPFDAGYCHCRNCQMASGASVLAFATVPIDAFQVTRGAPARYPSSNFGERWFCRDCGTPLAIRVDFQPDTLDFTIASLDEPARVEPGFHIFTRSKVPWFAISDSLPRHEQFRAHTRGLSPGIQPGQ